jgi:nucleotide-binding universal stress UspA family protein
MKFLVPTDFSKCARNATEYACELALEVNADIVLLNTFHFRYSDSGFFIDFDLSVKEISEKQMESELDRLTEKFPLIKNLNIRTVSEVGGLLENIEIIEENELIDYIIMGTKGRSGWEEILIGSQTASVISNSKTPLIVVPNEAKWKPAKRAAFAVNLDERFTPNEVHFTKQLMQDKAPIHLFHVYSDVLEMNIKEEEKLQSDFEAKYAGQEVYLDFDYDKSKTDSVEDYLEEIQPDLIVARTKHRTFFQQIFHVSIPKTLSFHAKVPMLILKEA